MACSFLEFVSFWACGKLAVQALIIGMGCKAKNRAIAGVLARFLNAADRPIIR